MPVARLLLLLPLLVLLAPAQAAEVAVHVSRNGDTFQVEASAEFDGTIIRTWQVLTDYGRLAEFVPDLQSSRVISRDGNQAVLEQKGQARVLFFSYPIDVRLAVTEQPHERVVSHSVSGNFREMRSVYSLEAVQGRVALRYTGRMVPDFYVPPVIGTLALKNNVEASFRALVEEIERQQAQPAPSPRGER